MITFPPPYHQLLGADMFRLLRMCAAQDGVSVSKALEDALQSRDAELSQRPGAAAPARRVRPTEQDLLDAMAAPVNLANTRECQVPIHLWNDGPEFITFRATEAASVAALRADVRAHLRRLVRGKQLPPRLWRGWDRHSFDQMNAVEAARLAEARHVLEDGLRNIVTLRGTVRRCKKTGSFLLSFGRGRPREYAWPEARGVGAATSDPTYKPKLAQVHRRRDEARKKSIRKQSIF
jgi:hypothetical protein